MDVGLERNPRMDTGKMGQWTDAVERLANGGAWSDWETVCELTEDLFELFTELHDLSGEYGL